MAQEAPSHFLHSVLLLSWGGAADGETEALVGQARPHRLILPFCRAWPESGA